MKDRRGSGGGSGLGFDRLVALRDFGNYWRRAAMAETTGEVVCPGCRAAVSMRVNRNGFLQRSVLGHFGIYPWKCGACGLVFLYKRRGPPAKPRRRRTDIEGGVRDERRG